MHGSVDEMPGFTYQRVINDVTAVYGAASTVVNDTNGKKVSTFLTSRLKIVVYEYKNIYSTSGIVSVITLK